jgi:hypothetical protein
MFSSACRPHTLFVCAREFIKTCHTSFISEKAEDKVRVKVSIDKRKNKTKIKENQNAQQTNKETN